MMIDETKICRAALKQFVSDSHFGCQFDPELYAQDLRENGYLNYFLNRLLGLYDSLEERQRIFVEWFPEFETNGVRFLSDLIRQSNSLSADFLDSCLFEAEKHACQKVLRSFLTKNNLSKEEMTVICGHLLAEERIFRRDFDLMKNSSDILINPTFIEVVSNGGISALQKLTSIHLLPTGDPEELVPLDPEPSFDPSAVSDIDLSDTTTMSDPSRNSAQSCTRSITTTNSSSKGSSAESRHSMMAENSAMSDLRGSIETRGTTVTWSPDVKNVLEQEETVAGNRQKQLEWESFDEMRKITEIDLHPPPTKEELYNSHTNAELIEMAELADADKSHRQSSSKSNSDSHKWSFVPIKHYPTEVKEASYK